MILSTPVDNEHTQDTTYICIPLYPSPQNPRSSAHGRFGSRGAFGSPSCAFEASTVTYRNAKKHTGLQRFSFTFKASIDIYHLVLFFAGTSVRILMFRGALLRAVRHSCGAQIYQGFFPIARPPFPALN